MDKLIHNEAAGTKHEAARPTMDKQIHHEAAGSKHEAPETNHEVPATKDG